MLPGLAKEVYDAQKNENGFDAGDIGLNAIGAAGGFLLHYFLLDKKRPVPVLSYHSELGSQVYDQLRF
jgi:hypothetical protein